MENQNFLEQFGNIPNESGYKKRMRVHQGWWRMNVLAEEPGAHPKLKNSNVCSTIKDGHLNRKNFLTENVFIAVKQTLESRQSNGNGIMELDRLFNNLLSSQPLCFNFFGELIDYKLGLPILQTWWPGLDELKRVIFEFAPEECFTSDNSAFDVAFEVGAQGRNGLIGLECKYTDSFSSTVYDKPAYRKIYDNSNSFKASYKELTTSRFNQLFRNQLIAEALVQNKKYDFVHTGLFCYQNDESAIQTAQAFKKMLATPNDFKIITYMDFIQSAQRLELDWKQREWTMLLWARYCATIMSDPLNEKILRR